MEIASNNVKEPAEIAQTLGNTAISEAINPALEVLPENSGESGNTDFETVMMGLLKKSKAESVNEEELFAAVIEQRLGEHSEEAASFYAAEKAKLMSSMARADGYVNVEEVANKALDATIEAGHIDSDVGSQVRQESFAAAQLDDNLNALYDGRGSADDPTVALDQLSAALLKVSEALDKADNGELELSADTDETTPSESSGEIDINTIAGEQQLDGADGFLWKPVSEGDGNLVVLLPTELRGLIDRVEIHSSMPPSPETLLEEGRFDGDDKNGNRLHYRFEQPGAEYGDNVNLVAYRTDGEAIFWNIANGADRHD